MRLRAPDGAEATVLLHGGHLVSWIPAGDQDMVPGRPVSDQGRLLDRAEALRPALIEASKALIDARTQLADRLFALDTHVIAMTERAKVVGVQHILAKSEEAARRSVEAQNRAMSDAAHTLFRTELTPALQHFTIPLQRLVQRLDRPRQQWWTHAATGAVASVATLVLMTWLRAR